jgi:hypothetical protein
MTTEMNGRRQLARSATATATPAAVWAILMDSRLLPEWATVVREVESCDTAGEAVGAVRRCRVELAGRAGTMVERCIGLDPQRQVAYVVDDESFGLRRLLADYGFRISLAPVGPDETRVTIETFYTPRNLLVAMMNGIMMRRRFRGVVDQLLAGLVRLAEADRRRPGSLSRTPREGQRG